MTLMPKSLVRTALWGVENVPISDALLRQAISLFIGMTDRADAGSFAADSVFAEEMRSSKIALHTDAANDQHYELPEQFFGHVLGPHRKYSCCFFETGAESLSEAEARALELTADRADLGDGQHILELGCGWGSLTVWMAKRYPNAIITAVSNSHGQRRYIQRVLRERGLTNVTVITADMNVFCPEGSYDRVVSVEMFEHLSNWAGLLRRVRDVLADDGRAFLHVFAHRGHPYRFDHRDEMDWIGQHFFTGGIMPSEGLIDQFSDLLVVEQRWRWAGTHYSHTARRWLELMDQKIELVRPILKDVYGSEAALWERRWRLFFLATEGLFGHDDGRPWGVMHYRLRKP